MYTFNARLSRHKELSHFKHFGKCILTSDTKGEYDQEMQQSQTADKYTAMQYMILK